MVLLNAQFGEVDEFSQGVKGPSHSQGALGPLYEVMGHISACNGARYEWMLTGYQYAKTDSFPSTTLLLILRIQERMVHTRYCNAQFFESHEVAEGIQRSFERVNADISEISHVVVCVQSPVCTRQNCMFVTVRLHI